MIVIDYCRQHWGVVMLMTTLFSMNVFGDDYTVPVAFRKVGFLAESLTYCHLKIDINLTDLYQQRDTAKAIANITMTHLVNKMGLYEGLDYASLFGAIEKSFEPTDRLVESVKIVFTLTEIPPEGTLGSPYSGGSRGKRQAGVAFLAVTTLFNTGLSLYNTYEISVLNGEVSHIKEGMVHIIETVSAQNIAIESIKGSLVALNKTSYKVAVEVVKVKNSVDFLAVFTTLQAKIAASTQEFALFCQGLLELLNGRFSPFLVDKLALLRTFDKVKTKVADKGYHLLYDFPSSIFKQEISYTVVGDVVKILVHLPIIKDTPLPIYEYLSVPLIAPNMTNGPLMFAESREGNTLLLWDPANDRGAELPGHFLHGCGTAKLVKGTVYLCDDFIPIMSEKPEELCLGLLFGRKLTQEKLFAACRVVFSKQSVFAQQIDLTTFLVYSRDSEKLTVHCSKSSQTNYSMVQGIQTVAVPPGCQAQLKNLLMFARGEVIEVESDSMISLPVPLTISDNFFPVTKMAALYTDLEDVRLPDKVDVTKLEEWVRDDKWRSTATNLGSIAFGTLTMIILIIGGYVGFIFLRGWWRRHQERRHEQRLASASRARSHRPAVPREEEEEDEVELQELKQ